MKLLDHQGCGMRPRNQHQPGDRIETCHPASAMGGTSGNVRKRVADEMPSAIALPSRINGTAGARSQKMIGT
jgi:hypothetical protein